MIESYTVLLEKREESSSWGSGVHFLLYMQSKCKPVLLALSLQKFQCQLCFLLSCLPYKFCNHTLFSLAVITLLIVHGYVCCWGVSSGLVEMLEHSSWNGWEKGLPVSLLWLNISPWIVSSSLQLILFQLPSPVLKMICITEPWLYRNICKEGIIAVEEGADFYWVGYVSSEPSTHFKPLQQLW